MLNSLLVFHSLLLFLQILALYLKSPMNQESPSIIEAFDFKKGKEQFTECPC